MYQFKYNHVFMYVVCLISIVRKWHLFEDRRLVDLIAELTIFPGRAWYVFSSLIRQYKIRSYILLISKCSFLPLQKLYRGPHVSWHTHLIAATHNNTLSLHIWIRHTQHTINPPALGNRLLAVTWSKVSAGDSFALEINVHHTQNHCVLLLFRHTPDLESRLQFYTPHTHTSLSGHHCLDSFAYPWINIRQ